MTPEMQQAREIGEITTSVKNLTSIVVRMEAKFDDAIATQSSHTNTISLLSRISSENSGALIQIQETIYGKDKQSGMAKDVAELKKYKCERERFDEENRKGTKQIFFSIIKYVATAVIGGWLVAKGLLGK